MNGRGAVSLPWAPLDLWRLAMVNGVVMIAAVATWWAASGTVRSETQIMAAGVGVAAVVMSGVANARWLLVGRRAVAARRAATVTEGARLLEALPRRAARPGARSAAVLVALSGGRRYHQPSCQLVVGKALIEASSTEHETAGRRACGMCCP